jgi:ADP-heptose:LPS heptosyltransferase
MKSKSIAKSAIRILRSWQRLFFPSLINNDGRININAKKRIRSILITRFQRLGDMILFIPTLRELRKLFPMARIDLLCLEPLGIETIKHCPYIDGIITCWEWQGFIKKWLGRLKARMKRYDLFITSCAESTLARFGVYVGAKYIVGFKEKIRFGASYEAEELYLLDIALDYDPTLHEVEQNLKIVKALGSHDVDSSLEYYLSKEDTSFIRNLLNKQIPNPNGPLICVHPGSNQPQKRWIPEKFAEVCSLLINKFRANIVFIGALEEKDLTNRIIQFLDKQCINLVGNITLGQLAAVLSESVLLIGNDSGPMHLAAAVGTPIVALFGGGEYTYWKPWTDKERAIIIRHMVPCAPCSNLDCQDNICMKNISVKEVSDAAISMFNKKGYKPITQ